MAGMGGMQSAFMQAGIQGAQNTSRQENMQRQALFQNIMGAMDDSAWLMQHFPNFYGWNAQGGGGGGYEAGTVAPMVPAASQFNMPREASDSGISNSRYKTVDTSSLGKIVVAPDDYYKSPQASSMGISSGISGGYSSLWS